MTSVMFMMAQTLAPATDPQMWVGSGITGHSHTRRDIAMCVSGHAEQQSSEHVFLERADDVACGLCAVFLRKPPHQRDGRLFRGFAHHQRRRRGNRIRAVDQRERIFASANVVAMTVATLIAVAIPTVPITHFKISVLVSTRP